jgi:hypothetical protein
MSFHLSFAQVFVFQVTEKASTSPQAGDTWRYLPDLPPARKALGVALVAVVAMVIVEGTGVGAASIHRLCTLIY